jgi:hypothetical protein
VAEVFLANRHTGDFLFPYTTQGGLRAHFLLEKGHSSPIPKEVWDSIKDHEIIQWYLDHGHLELLKEAKEVAITEEKTSDPPIPQHLQDEEQQGNDPVVKAKVKRGKHATIEVS